MAKGSGRGAGAYTGYSKNFVPIKSTKGTRQDAIAADLLAKIFGNSGGERVITLKDGRKFKATLQESGVSGPVGAALSAAGKAVVKGAGGKTERAVAADAAKAASRRTASESATIRKGTQAGRTADKAVQLEKQAAKDAASKSVNVAPRSPVAPRPSGAEGPKVPAKAMDKFVKGRKFADPKKAKADLEEQLRVGARMRAEGRAPGSDVPYRDGSVPLGNPTAAAAKPAAKPRAPKPTAQETKAAAFAKGLTKPKNPGAKASAEAKAKFQKDLAAYEKRVEGMSSKTKAINEGRLKADGTPKGATAKSIARNQRNQAKKAGAEGPKKPATTPPAKPKAAAGAEGPKRELIRVPSTQGRRGGGSSSAGSKPIALGAKPFSKSREVATPETIKGEVIRVKDEWRSSSKPKGGLGKKSKAAIALGAMGASGYALDKGKNQTSKGKSNERLEGPKARVPVTRSGSSEGTESKPGIGQSKAPLKDRKKQNEKVKDGTVRIGRGRRMMRRYNAKTGRWDAVSPTDTTTAKFLKERNKALKDRSRE